MTLGVLGADLTSKIAVPFWTVARSIEIGEILQRLEVFLLVIWVTGVIIKASLLCYLINLGITQVLGFKKLNLVLGATAVTQLAITNFMLGNASQVSAILGNYWPPFGITFELVIPIFLLGICWLRQKGKQLKI